MTRKVKIWKGIWLALAILNLCYGIMVYLVGSGTNSFLIWAVLAVVCFYLFWRTGTGVWTKKPLGLKVLISVLLCVILNVFLLCQAAILSGMFQHGQPDMDYIIVLGAQMRDSGPSIVFRYRLDEAYAYLQENPNTVCIVTGGQGSNEPVSEGEGGKAYLVAKGIPENRILTETVSTTTKENLENTLPLLVGDVLEKEQKIPNDLKIGIVTNNYHVFRGATLAERALLVTDKEVKPVTSVGDTMEPVIVNSRNWVIKGIAAYMQPRFLPNNMVRETFGILKDLI